MNIARLCKPGLLAAALVLSGAAWAHHSFSMYDVSRSMVYTGVVVRVNPDANHLQIFFAPLNEQRNAVLKQPDGKPQIWSVEMGQAATEAKNGISVQTFKPGTIFSVGVVPRRDDPHIGNRLRWGLFSCPEKTPPAPGKYCDSVPGSKAHGSGTLPKPGDPGLPPGTSADNPK